MFFTKRGQSDINPAVSFLVTCIQYTAEEDWGKLVKIISYLERFRDDILNLQVSNEQV